MYYKRGWKLANNIFIYAVIEVLIPVKFYGPLLLKSFHTLFFFSKNYFTRRISR